MLKHITIYGFMLSSRSFWVSYYLYVKYRILASLAYTTRVLGQIYHLLINILGMNLCFADFVLSI